MKPEAQLPYQVDRNQIGASFDAEYQRLIREFETLVSSIDAEYIFQILVTQFLLTRSSPQQNRGAEQTPAHVELAAYFLYPRFGQGGSRDHKLIQDFFDLLEQLHLWRGLATANDAKSEDQQIAMLQIHLMLEAELVRGSTYSPLMRLRIEGIQCPFDGWFMAALGVGPCRALEIIDAYLKALNQNFAVEKKKLMGIYAQMAVLIPKLQKKRHDANVDAVEHQRTELGQALTGFLDNTGLQLAPSFSQIKAIISELSQGEWDSLRSLIGLTVESRRNLAGPRELRSRPLYWLSGDRILYLDVSCVYDALFEVYDSITRLDANKGFRDSKYVVGLSTWMEKEVPRYFQRVFQASSLFSNLTYPDPDNPGGEAELDAAIIWGPFLLLCEIKGKQYRAKSRLGDLARLKTDLKDNIEEAFAQATRAIKYIDSNSTTTFVEKGSGRKLHVDTSTVRTIFPMSVTLHDFGGLATQLALLKNIGMFKSSAYPWSLSLANLDLVTRFAGSPDVFLHYAQRRLDLQRSGKDIQGDEIDLFGHYLDTRLHPSLFWERKTPEGKDFTLMQLTGATEQFDQWFRVECGMPGEKPEIKLRLPALIGNLFEGLRKRDDYESRWIAFTLLNLSPQAMERLNSSLQGLYQKIKSTEQLLRSSTFDSGIAVSFVMGAGVPAHILEQHTIRRTNIEKYRFKSNVSVGIGFDGSDGAEAFEFACWTEGEWVENPELEKLIQAEKPKLLPGQKLPGRNEPCICGSNKKFKKCCIHKFTTAKDNP